MMKSLKLALCSTLLVTSAMAVAQPTTENVAADKRVITMAPVSSKGYMLYNLGVGVMLKQVDLSQIPQIPGGPDMSKIQAFLDSYTLANVVVPSKPTYNGKLSFDVVATDSGKGLGHYEFEQTYKGGTVTLRVITNPLPGIPMAPEMMEAMQYVTQIANQ